MRKILAVLALAALSACGADATSPFSSITPLTLTFSVATTSAGHSTTTGGQLGYACTYQFSVNASGNNAVDLAGWTDGEINYRLQATGQTATNTLYSSDLQDWFGTNIIRAGATLTATRSLTWSGPFTANVLFRYIVTSDGIAIGKTATIPVTCA